MIEGPTDRVERWLFKLSAAVRGRARLVVGVSLLVGTLFGWYAANNLRINTDTSSLVSDDLDYRRIQNDYDAAFPGTEREFLVVLSGATPALADEGARRLKSALEAEPELFRQVYSPGVGEFWDARSLLYLPVDSLRNLVERIEDAEIAVINTCSFIESAREESIQAILEVAERREAGELTGVVVTGCLPQRYGEELAKELPEVDAFVGTGDYPAIARILDETLEGRSRGVYVEAGRTYLHRDDDPRRRRRRHHRFPDHPTRTVAGTGDPV